MICADCKWIKKCSYPPDTAYYCRRYDMYVHEQTNEEWLRTCSTEEFTEELAKVVLDLVAWNNDPKPSEVRNILKAWLKQPHSEVAE